MARTVPSSDAEERLLIRTIQPGSFLPSCRSRSNGSQDDLLEDQVRPRVHAGPHVEAGRERLLARLIPEAIGVACVVDHGADGHDVSRDAGGRNAGQRRNEIQGAVQVRIDDLSVKGQVERFIVVQAVDPGVQDEDVRQLARRRQLADQVLDAFGRTDVHALEPDGRIPGLELRDRGGGSRRSPSPRCCDVMLREGPAPARRSCPVIRTLLTSIAAGLR